MEKHLSLILEQCEKQADKLLRIEVDDTFMKEHDIFSTYFEQLKQVINEKNSMEYRKRLDNLHLILKRLEIKLKNAMSKTMAEIKNTETKKRSIGYGYQQISEAIKFDKRL